MDSKPKDYVEIYRGIKSSANELKRFRFEKIRKSSIVRDVDAFETAYRDAKARGVNKPKTGLIRLREILTKMNP